MKMSLVAAAALFFTIGLLTATQSAAQRPSGTQPSRNGLAVLDAYSLVQSSTRLKQAKEAMEAEINVKKEEFKKESEQGKALAEKFRNMPPNNPDREKLERQILKMKADFELSGKKFERDTQEKELKVFYALSREMREEVERYAKANNLQLVLRVDPTPTDLNDPAQIASQLRKVIVYQRGLDVSPPIIEALNRRAPGAPATARAPNKPVQR